jgi:outer membrane protein
MRLSQWIATAALCVVALPQQAVAQTRIAVVDFQTALLNTADIQKKAAALEAKFKPRQDEIEQLSKELEQIQAKLQTASAADGPALQADGERKQRRAQRISEDLQSDVEFDRQNILNSAGGQMREVVQALRVEKAVDLIVDVSSVLAFDTAIDLTQAATAAYDAKHPAE